MTFDTSALVGIEIVFVDTILAPIDKSVSKVFLPGETLTLSSVVIDASIDHEGGSWLELLDDVPGQQARYGNLAFRRA